MVEHPIETARRCLREAAAAEDAPLQRALLAIAEELPDRYAMDSPPDPARDRAWAFVLEGVELALTERDLRADDRARLVRMRASARRLLGLPVLVPSIAEPS